MIGAASEALLSGSFTSTRSLAPRAKRTEILIDCRVDFASTQTVPHCNGWPSRYLNNICRSEQAQVKRATDRPQRTTRTERAPCSVALAIFYLCTAPQSALTRDVLPHEYFIAHFCYDHASVVVLKSLQKRNLQILAATV